MLRLGSDGLLRVGELAAVQVADLETDADGSGRLRLAASKTGQEGRGQVLYVGAETVRAIQAWQDAGRDRRRRAVPPPQPGRERDRRTGAHAERGALDHR